jgi:hypothetical protein
LGEIVAKWEGVLFDYVVAGSLIKIGGIVETVVADLIQRSILHQKKIFNKCENV